MNKEPRQRDDPVQKPAEGPTARKLLYDNAEKAAAALLTAGGLAAFLGASGAAINWVRFHAARLPATQAVESVSTSDRIAIGASTLAVFIAGAALAVLIAYAIEPGGRATRNMAWGLIAVATAETILVVILFLLGKGPGRVVGACALVVVGAVVLIWRTTSDSDHRFYDDVLPSRTESRSARHTKADHRGDLRDASKPPKRFDLTVPGRIWFVVVTSLVATGVGLILWEWWIGALVALAVVLAWANFYIARHTGSRFAWYGVSIFFAVLTWGAVAEILRLNDRPLIQPAALILSDKQGERGVQGLFIGKDDKQVTFGSVATRGCESNEVRSGTGRITSYSRDEVVALSIGPPQRVADAAGRARDMLEELVAARPGGGKRGASGTQLRKSLDAAPAVRQEPLVVRLSPDKNEPGRVITIAGEDFGKRRSSITVGGKRVRPLSWSKAGDRITFKVPRGVPPGAVTVTVNCFTPLARPILVVLAKPVANPMATPDRRNPLLYHLSARGSRDPDGGEIKGFTWKTGGRALLNEMVSKVKLARDQRVARVTLTVVDDDRRTDTARLTILRLPSDFLFCSDCRTLDPNRTPTRRALSFLRRFMRGASLVRIDGHTDARRSLEYNRVLGRDRAKAVARALRRRLRHPPRFQLRTFGKTRPVATNATPQGRARNRRVEILVLASG